MRIALLLVALLSPLVLVHADDEKKESAKLEAQIVGKWKLAAAEIGGKPAAFGGLATSTFKDGKYDLVVDGQEQETGTYKLDGSKSPAWLDLAIESGGDKGKKQPGIVAIDGDTLKFCLAQPGKDDRPTKFETSEKDQYILITMKRMKDK
jgi:uncharacterized protein (TIGR03067 family)